MPLEGRTTAASSATKPTTATATTTTNPASISELISPTHQDSRRKFNIPAPPLHSTFHFGFCEEANLRRRRRMEDAHSFVYDFAGKQNHGFFAIYDGHGGKSAADWCSENLHRILAENWERDPDGRMPELLDRTFMEVDEQLDPAHGIYSGCTAIVAVLVPDSSDNNNSNSNNNKNKVKLFTANVGDARAVLCRRGRAIRLSFDHQARVPEERQRIKECGGLVINDRVNGTLAVTRALGDASMKEFISGHPFTTETTLLSSDEDSFLILACDGLWDVCSDQEACDYISADIDDPQRCAELLTAFALEQGSTDNLSVIVVRLAPPKSAEKDSDSEDKITHADVK